METASVFATPVRLEVSKGCGYLKFDRPFRIFGYRTLVSRLIPTSLLFILLLIRLRYENMACEYFLVSDF